MKYLVFFSFWVITVYGCKKTLAPVTPDKIPIYSLKEGYEFQQVGMDSFNTNARLSSMSLQKAAVAFLQNKNPKDAGVCLSTAAHLYEEKFSDIDSALLLSRQALNYALESNDTLNTGHSYRYSGFLTGMAGNLGEGLSLIEKSIPYYMMMNEKDGIAVAKYDMARILGHNKQYAQSKEKLEESTLHFKSRINLQRIFNNNVYGLKLFKESNNPAEYERVKTENEYLIQSGKISPVLQKKYIDMLELTKSN
ncbi:MAG: hypothetical protein IPN29_11945 [Saprospiraceae bacterium]|nr:hypothetical protein [Saprospiraceae bacterium]